MKIASIISLLLVTVCNAEITLMLKNQTVLENSNVTVPCTYTATDTEVIPIITWYATSETGKRLELFSLRKGSNAAKNPDVERELYIGQDGELLIPTAKIGDNKILSTLTCKVDFGGEMQKEGELNLAVVAVANAPPKTSLQSTIFKVDLKPVTIGKCVTGFAFPAPKVTFLKGSEEIQSQDGSEVLDETTDDFFSDYFLSDNVETSNGEKTSLSRTLVLPISKDDDNVEYTCEVTSGGGDSEDTMLVQKTPFPKFRVRYPTDNVTITVDKLKLFVGEEATFKCEANGFPPPIIEFEEQTSSTFVIDVIQKTDHGRQITCITRYNADSDVLEDSYTIEALYADEPTIEGETTLAYGEDISLSCSAGDSIPAVTKIMWKKGDVTVSNTAELELQKARFSDAGVYTCVTENGFDNLIRTVESGPITVHGLMFQNPKNKLVQGALKETVTLSCSASSSPEPTFTWRKVSDGSIRDGKVTRKGDTYTSKITVGPLEPPMSNEKFECTVVNGVSGDITKTFILPVISRPTEKPTQEEEILPESASPTAGIVIGVLVVALIIFIILAVLYKKEVICKKGGKGDEDAEDIAHVKMKPDNVASNRNDIEAAHVVGNNEQGENMQLMNGNGDQ